MASGSSMMMGGEAKIELIRIPPFSYLHVVDSNSNVTRVVEGPQTFTCMDHEVVVLGPVEMVALPPRHFCIVSNPAVRDAGGAVVVDGHGQAKLRHGDREVRLAREYPDPFPLYPGEELTPKTMIPLQVVPENTALRVRATRDFVDSVSDPDAPIMRQAGEEWLFRGHRTYYPQVEVEILDTLKAVVLHPNQALRIQARNPTVDANGEARNAGEEWLIQSEGAYLPGAEEIVVGVINAIILTDKTALRLRAAKDFVDVYGVERKTGEEWLVTRAMRESHIPGVAEDFVEIVSLLTLGPDEYVFVADPVDPETGVPDIGGVRRVVGPASFFLQPGESLADDGVSEALVLAEEEALLLTARFPVVDDDGVNRRPGDRWLWYGPGMFIPPVGVTVVARKRALLHIEGWLNWFFWITTATY